MRFCTDPQCHQYCLGHDAEAQSFPREIFVEHTTSSNILTSAWYNSDILSPNFNFVEQNPDVVNDATRDNANIKKAILIKEELSRFGFLVALNAWFLICIGVGIGVGFAGNSIDLGILVATRLAAFGVCMKAFHMQGYRGKDGDRGMFVDWIVI